LVISLPPEGSAFSRVAVFIVTRYDKLMKKPSKRRGRPPKANALTAAERMRAYRKRKRDAGFRSARHWVPADGEGGGRYSDHRILDARSLAMHCKIAQKISLDSKLLEIAKRNLARWDKKSSGQKPGYLQEWRDILDRPWLEIAEIITSMNEESTRLRSSSPFAGVLDDQERQRIYAAFRA